MKFFPLLLIFFFAGCSSTQFKPLSKQEFDAASQGKRIFVVGGPVSGKNTLYDFCDSFEQLVCSKRLDKYQGLKGYIIESEPFINDKYYFGYHVVLETGEELILKLSRIFEDKDPIESALHLIDANKLADIEKEKGKPLMDGVSISISSKETYGGLIKIILSNGETTYRTELDKRIQYLNDQIAVEDREVAFQTLSGLNLKFDDFEGRWWVKPKNYRDMPLYPYYGKEKDSKWLRLNAMYKDYDWIFFERITVVSASDRYENTFKSYDVSRDNGSNKVWEWVDIPVSDKEVSIIETLSNNPGKIRFSGKYTSTKDILPEHSKEIKDLMTLYDLTTTK